MSDPQARPGETEMDAWKRRAEEAERNLEAARDTRAKPSIWKRMFGWVRQRERWEQIVFAAFAFGLIALLVWVSEMTVAYLLGKAKHALAVLFYGLIGGFVGAFLAWTLNGVKAIRERAAPAADDSMRGIKTWQDLRPEGAVWTMQDAVTTLAACLRFGLSYLGIVVLAAVGMLMAA